MKKSLLIFGLFIAMTALTSFTEPTDVGGKSNEIKTQFNVGGKSNEIKTQFNVGGKSNEIKTQ